MLRSELTGSKQQVDVALYLLIRTHVDLVHFRCYEAGRKKNEHMRVPR